MPEPKTSIASPSNSTAANWQRSMRCSNNGCVEIARIDGDIALRDSKRPDGPVLAFDREEFGIFVNAVKAGEFDDLLR